MTVPPAGAGRAARTIALACGGAVYLVFLGTVAWMVAFLGGFGVPKTVDTGSTGSVVSPVPTDISRRPDRPGPLGAAPLRRRLPRRIVVA